MKVTDFKTMVVENEPPYIGGKYLLFLELHTDEGITGLGERITGGAYSHNIADLKTQIGLIEEMVRNFVIGENPFNIERTWDRMYASRHDFRHPSLYATPVISAVDMALWDIAGKAANQPIYNLLGGQYHETLRAYAYMPGGAYHENPEAAGEVAAQLLEEGNSACKLDPFSPSYPIPRDIPLWEIERAAKIFESIRNAVGNRLEVGIGTHGQLTTYSAIRVADYLEPYHPFWFEEPVPPENIDEMARVAAHTSIPIATGERLVTKYEFAQGSRKEGRADHPAGRGSVRRHNRGQEDSRHRGGTLRDDSAAYVLWPDSRRFRRPNRHLLAQLPDTGSQHGPAPQDDLQRTSTLRKRPDHPADGAGA